MNSDKSQFTFEINAKDIGASSTLKKVRDQLDGLKEVAGKGSFLGQAGALLKGGGGVAGLTIFANLLGQTAKRATELGEAVTHSGMGIRDAAADVVRSIPVFGSFVRMMDNIVEFGRGKIFGFEEPIEQIEQAAKAAEARVARAHELMKKVREEGERSRESIFVMSGQDDVERNFRKAQVKFREQMEKIAEMERLTPGADRGAIAQDIANARNAARMALQQADSEMKIRRDAERQEREDHELELARKVADVQFDALRSSADAVFDLRMAQLSAIGDSTTAEIERIRNDARVQIEAIARDLERKLRTEGLTMSERSELQDLAGRRSDAVRQTAEIRERTVVNARNNDDFRKLVDEIRARATQTIPSRPQRGATVPVEGLGFAQSQLSAERASFDPLIRAAVEQKRIAQDQLRALRAMELGIKMLVDLNSRPVQPIFQ